MLSHCHTDTEKKRNINHGTFSKNHQEFHCMLDLCNLIITMCGRRMAALELFVLIVVFFSIPLDVIRVDRFDAIACGSFFSCTDYVNESASEKVSVYAVQRGFLSDLDTSTFSITTFHQFVRRVHIYTSVFQHSYFAQFFPLHACERIRLGLITFQTFVHTPDINYIYGYGLASHRYMHVNAEYYTS